jgi:hypothetical protein
MSEAIDAYERNMESAYLIISKLTSELNEARKRERVAAAAYTQQQAELEAARAIIAIVRDVVSNRSDYAHWFMDELADYDVIVMEGKL